MSVFDIIAMMMSCEACILFSSNPYNDDSSSVNDDDNDVITIPNNNNHIMNRTHIPVCIFIVKFCKGMRVRGREV